MMLELLEHYATSRRWKTLRGAVKQRLNWIFKTDYSSYAEHSHSYFLKGIP